MRALWVLCVAGCWFASARAQALQPVVSDDELYTESFVVIADLDDGTYAKIQLGISNAGPGDANGACRIYLAPKDRPAVSKGSVHDREEWRFEGSTLTIGKCRALSGSTLSFEAVVDDVKATLELLATPEKTRVPAHSMKNGDDYYDLEVLVPWAQVRATYVLPGEAPRTTGGYAYADHSRANALPGKIAKAWVRFRALGKDHSRLVLVRFPPTGKPFAGWHWEQPQRMPVELSRAQLQPGKSDNKTKSWRVMLDGEGGPWRITSGKLIQRDAPIEERGALGSVLGAVVGNPVTYTYRAILEGKQDRATISGILEVTLADE